MCAELIRPARPSDWPEIERLLRQHDLPLAGAREVLSSFFVLEVDAAIEGCAALEQYGGTALLRSVAVAERQRGTGVGSRLVEHILDRTGSETPIVLLTTTAAGWFTRFGFRTIAREEAPPAVTASVEFREACPSSATVMIRDAGS